MLLYAKTSIAYLRSRKRILYSRDRKRNLVWKNYILIVPVTSEEMSVFSARCLESRAADAGLREPGALAVPSGMGLVQGGDPRLQQGFQQQPNYLDKLVQEKLMWLSFSIFINFYF